LLLLADKQAESAPEKGVKKETGVLPCVCIDTYKYVCMHMYIYFYRYVYVYV